LAGWAALVAQSVNILRLNNPATLGSKEYRQLEIPAANGFGQARAIARIYSVLAGDGRELGISAATRSALFTPGPAPREGTRDAVLKIDMNYGFGFSKPSRGMSFGLDANAFGCPGAGGCLGLADPQAQIGFAYITNKMGFRLFDDPRERACREACYDSLSKLRQLKWAA
jgi:CubicO group peptidase (beta-lactamase class C family)